MKKKLITILGGGITGLVAAYYLSKNYKVILLEKEKELGGTASSFNNEGFSLDYGPHKLYTELPGIIEEIQKITPLIKVEKKNSIYLKNNYFDFPLKLGQIAKKIPTTAFKSGFDILLKLFTKKPDDSYENFLLNRFGKTMYDLSFRDYAFKVWNSNPQDLDRELAKRRVAVSNIFALIKSILFKKNKEISAEFFYYPKNGMKQLFDSLTSEIKKNKGKIIINAQVSQINIKSQKIQSIKYKNKILKPDYLISTIPLDSLAEITKYDGKLELGYQKLNILYIILNKKRALNDCWVFFPERKFLFQRISEQKAFSKDTCPKGKTAIMVETTKKLDNTLIQEAIFRLINVGALKLKDIDTYFVKSIEKAYPLYKKGYSLELNKFINFIENINNFYLIGRQGLFNYNNMDQCWDMAWKLSEQIKQGKTKQAWQETKKYFDKYRIVD